MKNGCKTLRRTMVDAITLAESQITPRRGDQVLVRRMDAMYMRLEGCLRMAGQKGRCISGGKVLRRRDDTDGRRICEGWSDPRALTSRTESDSHRDDSEWETRAIQLTRADVFNLRALRLVERVKLA
jgi:hypothetical protein